MEATDDRRVAELLGSDPLVGNEAVDYFSSLEPDCLRIFLPLGGSPVSGTGESQLRFAKLCRRFGDAAIPILLEALEKGPWWTKVRAASGFDLYPFKGGDENAGQLAGLLTNQNFDVVNSTMKALGHMGAYSWAYRLIDDDMASIARGKYAFEKLAGTALQAMLMMVARTKDVDNVDYVLYAVEQLFDAMEEHLKAHSPAAFLHSGSLDFGQSAADPLVRKWLRHSKRVYREVSLESLAVIGLSRTATAVAERLQDTSEDENLRSSAARCLGDIGGPVAVETLQQWLGRSGLSPALRNGVLGGLSSAYPEATSPLEPRVIEEILQAGSASKLHLAHSLGFRREGEAYVRPCLHDTDPLTRGAAALSLARILGAEALSILRVARREATDKFELALVLCALILAGETSITRKLCGALSELSVIWRLRQRWKNEFIGALAADDPHLAAAWSEVMQVEPADCLERLAAWKGAYPTLGKSAASLPRREMAADAVATQSQARDLIFISYSHADDELCEEFLKMLRPTAQKHGLKIWSDHEIPVGAIWRTEIEKALARTRIAVLLVSSDFLASSFIKENELPPLLEAAGIQGARIFWIACRPSNVEDTEIGKFQGANRPSKPLSTLSKVAREKELQRISQELFRLSQATGAGSPS